MQSNMSVAKKKYNDDMKPLDKKTIEENIKIMRLQSLY